MELLNENGISINETWAPVVIFLYNRPEHTKQMLECLDSNYGIENTEVFIFCDGPKGKSIDKKIESVRQIATEFEKTSSARRVKLFFSNHNNGLANSVIGGVSRVISKYKRVIVLEDDILVDKLFLKYINEALIFYQNCKNIWSITGYSFEMKALRRYKHDIYYSYRGCSWSWATWLDRWNLVDWNVESFNIDKKNLNTICRFNRGGLDLFDMLTDQMEGRIDSWAVRWCYSQSKNNMYTIYPRYALVKNIGCDGSGTHSGITDKFVSNMRDNQNIRFEELQINSKITREFRRKYGGTITKYLISKLLQEFKKFVKSIIRG